MTGAGFYPVFLDLRGRSCVVLGDTAVARSKATGLRTAGALVTHHARAFAPGDLLGRHLAVDASGDPAGNAAARLEATRERVLLNVVDVASRSDWIAPAVVRRGPLQIAVSTSGESPFLASTLRARLEATIGEEWGLLTILMGGMRRRLRRRGTPPEHQQRSFRRLLRSDALELLRNGRGGDAVALAASLETDAHGRGAGASGGEVLLVGAGPGDPGLLTLAGREALMNADLVLHDSLVSRGVLDLCRSTARLVDVGKRGGRPSTAQADINDALIEGARAGDLVVRLKGGDPYLFGRGSEEVAALRSAGVPVRVIPGVSAALAAPAAAGIALTHRGVAASVAIISGHRAGVPDDALERLGREADTLVVLMPGDLERLTARLGGVVGGGRPAALISSATTAQQAVVRAPLEGLAAAARAAGLEPPATLVVGAVAALPPRDAAAPPSQGLGLAAARPAGGGLVPPSSPPDHRSATTVSGAGGQPAQEGLDLGIALGGRPGDPGTMPSRSAPLSGRRRCAPWRRGWGD